ncbi:MAG: HD domain-containing protein, partial [Candidatus Eremiobacteraeota bacterium]|nr:HD domain-containing protein [Candidatus Eremiobacteraeota bacterium]
KSDNNALSQFLNKTSTNEGLASPLIKNFTKSDNDALSQFLNRTGGSEALSKSVVKSFTAANEQPFEKLLEKLGSQEKLASSFARNLTKSGNEAVKDLQASHRESLPAAQAPFTAPSAPDIRSHEHQPRQNEPEKSWKSDIPGEKTRGDLQSPEIPKADAGKGQPSAQKSQGKADKPTSGHFEGSRVSPAPVETESSRPHAAMDEKAPKAASSGSTSQEKPQSFTQGRESQQRVFHESHEAPIQREQLPREARTAMRETAQPASGQAPRLDAPFAAERPGTSKPGASEQGSSSHGSSYQGGSSSSEHEAQSAPAPAQGGLMAPLPGSVQQETLKNAPAQESRPQPRFGQQEPQSGGSQAAPFDGDEDQSFTRSAAGTLREEKAPQEKGVIIGTKTGDKPEEVNKDSSASDDQDQSQEQRSGGKRQEREQQEKNQRKGRQDDESAEEDAGLQENTEEEVSSTWIATIDRQPVPPVPPPVTQERAQTIAAAAAMGTELVSRDGILEDREKKQKETQVIPQRLNVAGIMKDTLSSIAGFMATGSIMPTGWFGHMEGHTSQGAEGHGSHGQDAVPAAHSPGHKSFTGMVSSFADWLTSQAAAGVQGVSEKYTESILKAFEPLNKIPEIKELLDEINDRKSIDTATAAKLLNKFVELSRTEEGRELLHGFMKQIGSDPALATALLMTMAAAAQTPEGKELLKAMQSRIGKSHHLSRALLKIAATAMKTPEGRAIVEAYLMSILKDEKLVARHLEILGKAGNSREFQEYMRSITHHHNLSNLEMHTRIHGLNTPDGRDALREFYKNISQDPDSAASEMWLRATVAQTQEGLSLLTEYNFGVSSYPDIAAHDISMRTVAMTTTEGIAAVTLYNTFMASSPQAASSELSLREAASVTPQGMEALMRYESLLGSNSELAASEEMLLNASVQCGETQADMAAEDLAALLEKLQEKTLTREELEKLAELLMRELPRDQQELLLKLLAAPFGEKQAKLLAGLLGGKLNAIQRQSLAGLISGELDGPERKLLALLLASFSTESHGDLLQKILKGGLSQDQRKFLTALLESNLPKAQLDMLLGLLSSNIPHDQKMFIISLLSKPLNNEQRVLLLSVLKANLPFEARQALIFLLMRNTSPEEQKIIMRLLTETLGTGEKQALLTLLTRDMTARQRNLIKALFSGSLTHSQKETIIALLARSSHSAERPAFLKLLAINATDQEKLLIKDLLATAPAPGKADPAAQLLATKLRGEQKALLGSLATLREKDLPAVKRALTIDPASGKAAFIAALHGSKLGDTDKKHMIQLIAAPLQGAEKELFSAALASPLGFQQCSSALLKANITGEQKEQLISTIRKSAMKTGAEPGLIEAREIKAPETTAPAFGKSAGVPAAGRTVEAGSKAAQTAKIAEADHYREIRRTMMPREGSAGVLSGGKDISHGSPAREQARSERRISEAEHDEAKQNVEVYQRDPREMGQTQGGALRTERDLSAERRAAGAREGNESYSQSERSVYGRTYLDDSDLLKSFKLSSRAYHFVNYIFEDILKRKLGASEFNSDYFMQYLCLLMRTSGEFTFAHSLRTQTIALNIAKYANITDKKTLEQIRLGSVLCNIGELDLHFQDAPEEKMGQIKQFLSDQDFLLAGVLHDIGKIKIPDEILYKPGALTDEEFKTMKMHPIYSEMLLYPVYPLRHLCPVVRGHHEKWDGKGYPDGISGERIPLAARIIAIADVFDALISDRPYKKGMPWEKAKKIMSEGRGTHFDPLLLDGFMEYITPFYEKV